MICGGCGHPLDETTDPENRPSYAVERVVCGGCAAKELGQQKDAKDKIKDPGRRYRARDRSKS